MTVVADWRCSSLAVLFSALVSSLYHTHLHTSHLPTLSENWVTFQQMWWISSGLFRSGRDLNIPFPLQYGKCAAKRWHVLKTHRGWGLMSGFFLCVSRWLAVFLFLSLIFQTWIWTTWGRCPSHCALCVVAWALLTSFSFFLSNVLHLPIDFCSSYCFSVARRQSGMHSVSYIIASI